MRPILALLCMCFGVQGLKGTSNITLGSLPAKERNRRLIPYMSYYLGQPQNTQYRQVVAVIPVTGPYRHTPQRYVQQPTPLTRMITQNYLAIAKQFQGNPRLQTRIVSPNVHPGDVKYFFPMPNQQQNVQQLPGGQFSKSQSGQQYLKHYTQEQYVKPIENDYDLREQEPEKTEQYAKPPADALLQYVKPEVQQYVTKLRAPAHYPKQEQLDYDDNAPQNLPIQYLKTPEQQQYAKNVQPIYITKTQGHLSSYAYKPLIRFLPKLSVTGQKLAPQPADIPEYITRPNPKTLLQPPKEEEPTVTIMQSHEIDVESLPSTPTPVPKYHATYVEKPENYSPYRSQDEGNQEETNVDDLDTEVVDKNLNEVLQGLSISKSLPDRITTENLDSSIKTLSKILRILQRAHALPQSAKELVGGYPKALPTVRGKVANIIIPPQSRANEGSTPGRPGVDYPNYDEIPQTQFSCKEQRYKGFFGDPETGCQVWHYCDLNGGQASFLCPNGTIFSQVALTCDWWFNVKCASTTQLYVLNERLYKYILPHKPSFPEDYSGPLVDHYLNLKFKEIEEKNKNKTENKDESKEEEYEPPFSIDAESQNKVRSLG